MYEMTTTRQDGPAARSLGPERFTGGIQSVVGFPGQEFQACQRVHMREIGKKTGQIC
jgi:hypothetical protein